MNLYLIYMTREELIENHIYIASKIDDNIKVRLLIGDSVLFMRHNIPWIVKLTTVPGYPIVNPVLYSCTEEDIDWLCREFGIIAYNNYYTTLYSRNSQCHVLYISRENIDKFIKKLHD